mgnify:CR=1 FL=1
MQNISSKASPAGKQPVGGQWKFIVGGVLIAAAVIVLIVSATGQNSQYYLTIQELLDQQDTYIGKDTRISGVVIGDTIEYDPATLELSFVAAHIPGDQKEIDQMGGMAAALHAASLDPNLPRLRVVYHGVKPDLLTNEAQAIMTGKLGADGVFTATELLLKCPTKYEDALPQQAGSSQ